MKLQECMYYQLYIYIDDMFGKKRISYYLRKTVSLIQPKHGQPYMALGPYPSLPHTVEWASYNFD